MTIVIIIIIIIIWQQATNEGPMACPSLSHLTNTVLTDPFFAIAIRLQIPSTANRPLFHTSQRLCQQRASPIGKIHYYTCVW